MEKIKTGYRDFIIGETSIYKFILITLLEFQFVFIIFFVANISWKLGISYDTGYIFTLLCLSFFILYFTVPFFYKGKNKFLSINIMKNGGVTSKKYKLIYILIKLGLIISLFALLVKTGFRIALGETQFILDRIDTDVLIFLSAMYINMFILGVIYILYRIKIKLSYKRILTVFLSFYFISVLTATYISDSFHSCTKYLYDNNRDDSPFLYGDYMPTCEKLSSMNNKFVDLSLIYLYEEHLDMINSKLRLGAYNENEDIDKKKEEVEDKLFNKVNTFFKYSKYKSPNFSVFGDRDLSNLSRSYGFLLEQYSQERRNKYIYTIWEYMPWWELDKGYYKYRFKLFYEFSNFTSIPTQLKIAFESVDIAFLESYSEQYGLANYYLGEINKEQGNYNKAEGYYKKALKLGYDKDNKTTSSLGAIYINKNKLDLARALYEEKGNIEGLKELSNVNIEGNKLRLDRRLFNAEVQKLFKEGKYDELITLYLNMPESEKSWLYHNDTFILINSLRIKAKEKEINKYSYDYSAEDNYLIGKMYYTGKVPSLSPDMLWVTRKRDYASALTFWKNVHEHNGRETEEMRRILSLYKIEEAKCKEDLKACFYSDWNLPKLYDEN